MFISLILYLRKMNRVFHSLKIGKSFCYVPAVPADFQETEHGVFVFSIREVAAPLDLQGKLSHGKSVQRLF